MDDIAYERIAERGMKCLLHHRLERMTDDEARYGTADDLW